MRIKSRKRLEACGSKEKEEKGRGEGGESALTLSPEIIKMEKTNTFSLWWVKKGHNHYIFPEEKLGGEGDQ